MSRFDVITYGTDPNGRTIYMTRYMHAFWQAVVDALGFEPTIVQGAWMERAGGGADASAGYHDKAGCLDLRVWDRNTEDQQRMIRVCRKLGAGAWLRDAAHGGMDPHIHLVLGGDQDMHSGAAWQWSEYVAGRDGLSSRGADYHWRPDPLVTSFDYQGDDDMQLDEKVPGTKLTVGEVLALIPAMSRQTERTAARDARIRDAVLAAVDKAGDETVEQLLASLPEGKATYTLDDIKAAAKAGARAGARPGAEQGVRDVLGALNDPKES